MIFLSVVVVSLPISLSPFLSLSVGWRHIIMQTASTTTEQTASDKASRKGLSPISLSLFLIVHPLL